MITATGDEDITNSGKITFGNIIGIKAMTLRNNCQSVVDLTSLREDLVKWFPDLSGRYEKIPHNFYHVM